VWPLRSHNFDSGSARMRVDGSDLLKMLAQELGKLPNHIAMECHTDSKQYPAGASYGNWEPFADRANAAANDAGKWNSR